MIEVSHLTKRYGAHVAVEDLSFTVDKGVVWGFLGPNGAGKSTTMNILAGCLAATEGKVAIGGHDIFEEPIAARRQHFSPELAADGAIVVSRADLVHFRGSTVFRRFYR